MWRQSLLPNCSIGKSRKHQCNRISKTKAHASCTLHWLGKPDPTSMQIVYYDAGPYSWYKYIQVRTVDHCKISGVFVVEVHTLTKLNTREVFHPPQILKIIVVKFKLVRLKMLSRYGCRCGCEGMLDGLRVAAYNEAWELPVESWCLYRELIKQGRYLS